jgi:hypothetical protein
MDTTTDEDVDTANQNVKSYILTYTFYIAIVLYGTSIYFAENKENPVYNSLNYVFWLTIVLSQFFWGGFSYLAGQPNALGKSALAVFTTWIVLFVPMFTINMGQSSSGLNFAEELNSIFSNVVGYYWVSREANDILAKLNAIDAQHPTTVITQDLISAKILYSEIRNNKTLLINQLTPSNFDCIWNKLFKYLFELAGYKSPEQSNKIRDQLHKIVLQKYAIGKSFWYFYTAIICYSLSIYFMSIL